VRREDQLEVVDTSLASDLADREVEHVRAAGVEDDADGRVSGGGHLGAEGLGRGGGRGDREAGRRPG